MNLKKSDKMIAVIGVVILIVAAIGVILYVPENGEAPQNGGNGKEMSYNIMVKPHESKEMSTTYQLQLTKTFGKLDYKTTGKKELFTLDKDNVEYIEITVKYTDSQNSYPILSFLSNLLGRSKLGMDELSVTITDPDENKHVITLSGGKKNVTIHVSKMIEIETVEGKTEEEADMELTNMTTENSKWNGQKFQITGQLTINGKIGIFARLRERFGPDSFVVTYKYNYYEYELGEPLEEEPPSEPPTGINPDVPRATPWASMSLGGFR